MNASPAKPPSSVIPPFSAGVVLPTIPDEYLSTQWLLIDHGADDRIKNKAKSTAAAHVCKEILQLTIGDSRQLTLGGIVSTRLANLCSSEPTLDIKLRPIDKATLIYQAFSKTNAQHEPGKSLRDPEFFNKIFLPRLLTMQPTAKPVAVALVTKRPLDELHAAPGERIVINAEDIAQAESNNALMAYARDLGDVYDMLADTAVPSIAMFARTAKNFITNFPDAEPRIIAAALLSNRPDAKFKDAVYNVPTVESERAAPAPTPAPKPASIRLVAPVQVAATPKPTTVPMPVRLATPVQAAAPVPAAVTSAPIQAAAPVQGRTAYERAVRGVREQAGASAAPLTNVIAGGIVVLNAIISKFPGTSTIVPVSASLPKPAPVASPPRLDSAAPAKSPGAGKKGKTAVTVKYETEILAKIAESTAGHTTKISKGTLVSLIKEISGHTPSPGSVIKFLDSHPNIKDLIVGGRKHRSSQAEPELAKATNTSTPTRTKAGPQWNTKKIIDILEKLRQQTGKTQKGLIRWLRKTAEAAAGLFPKNKSSDADKA